MDIDKVIDYILMTPWNFNRAVLKSLVGDGVDAEGFEILARYCERTPLNSNRQVLRSLLSGLVVDNRAVVGQAIVGTAII